LPVNLIVGWYAGQFKFQNKKLLTDVVEGGYAPLRFVDHEGRVTERYPMNPNGSPEGLLVYL